LDGKAFVDGAKYPGRTVGRRVGARVVQGCPHLLAKSYAELSATEKEAVDLSAQDIWDERMCAAGLANDPAAFRSAFKGWTRAGLEAMERVRIKGGAT
jgi:hypothetical protein